VRTVLRVRRKGVVVLPKRLREAVGIEEGGEVIAEVVEGRLVIRPLKPKVVDVDLELVEQLLREEHRLEGSRFERMISGGEAGSRR
jgi:AbrB family looped-hinge helix DNA binding protein